MSNFILQFSVPELMALFGLIHSVYILVYISLRSKNFNAVLLPTLFFFALSCVFLLTAAQSRWGNLIPHYYDLKWALWAFCFPLSMLLVLKIIRITKNPSPLYWAFLILVPLSYFSIQHLSVQFGSDLGWYQVHSILIGSLSMLVIWQKRTWLDSLHSRKNGEERFWLIISHVVMNVGLLTIDLALLNKSISVENAETVRIIIGLAFVYIASTGLFRIFPETAGLKIPKEKKDSILSNSDIDIAVSIENLLYTDKVYQEPNYGRSQMASELLISESNLSRIVKSYFQKSLPQLLNELRVKEARVFLSETDADIMTISQEAGFNSIATFNRVFKEIEGVSPSEYRANKK